MGRNNILRAKRSEKRLMLLNIFKELLLKGEEVSYDMVLRIYNEKYNKEYNAENWNRKCSSEENNILKTIIFEIRTELDKFGYPLKESGNKNKTYKYDGPEGPFKNIEFKAKLEEWKSDFDFCIKEEQPVRITYKPFDKGRMNIIFHPHLLYLYNGRLFVFGVSEKEGKEPFRKFCIALDRIEGNIEKVDKNYIRANTGEYNYLNKIVGVTLEKNAELITIRLRAHDRYTFGRITTKPIHDSQRTVLYPGKYHDYGEVELKVYPNVELVGQILSYGSFLQVVSPKGFRERVANELCRAIEQYKR